MGVRVRVRVRVCACVRTHHVVLILQILGDGAAPRLRGPATDDAVGEHLHLQRDAPTHLGAQGVGFGHQRLQLYEPAPMSSHVTHSLMVRAHNHVSRRAETQEDQRKCVCACTCLDARARWECPREEGPPSVLRTQCRVLRRFRVPSK